MSSAVSTNAAAATESALCSLRPAAVISMRIRSSSDACARSAGFICADTGAHRPVTTNAATNDRVRLSMGFSRRSQCRREGGEGRECAGAHDTCGRGVQANEQELSQTIPRPDPHTAETPGRTCVPPLCDDSTPVCASRAA